MLGIGHRVEIAVLAAAVSLDGAQYRLYKASAAHRGRFLLHTMISCIVWETIFTRQTGQNGFWGISIGQTQMILPGISGD